MVVGVVGGGRVGWSIVESRSGCGCGGRLEWDDRTARIDAMDGGFVGSYGSIVRE